METTAVRRPAALAHRPRPAKPSPAKPSPAIRRLARDIFRELIEINTTDSAGDNTAARAMEKRFLAAGFLRQDVQLLIPPGRANKGNLVVRLHGAAGSKLKPVLLLGHLDVVEAKREDWTTNPFEFVEKDGYFYGRGTEDMKDLDAVMITAFLRFKQEGYTPSRDLILALTSDEEGGTANGVDWLLKNHRDLIAAGYVLKATPAESPPKKVKPSALASPPLKNSTPITSSPSPTPVATVPAPPRTTPSITCRTRSPNSPVPLSRLSSTRSRAPISQKSQPTKHRRTRQT